MSVVLIHPNRVANSTPPGATGPVGLPLGLAGVAGALRQAGVPLTVVDAFGARPEQARREEGSLLFGLTPAEVLARCPAEVGVALVQSSSPEHVPALMALLQALEHTRPDLPVVVLENCHSPEPFSLRPRARALFAAGADYLLTGETDETVVRLTQALARHPSAVRRIPGLCGPLFANPTSRGPDLDSLPLPAWDLLPLDNYWSGRHAHGPVTRNRYLPLSTSRSTHGRCRRRSVAGVVAEMALFSSRFRVREFHLEDSDALADERWVRELCGAIREQGLRIHWKVVHGERADACHDPALLHTLAIAGCRYLAFQVAPLGGHTKKADHIVSVVRGLKNSGIHSRACFVSGQGRSFDPPEVLRPFVQRLALVGLDEISFEAPAQAVPADLPVGFRLLTEQPESSPEAPLAVATEVDLGRLVPFFLYWKYRYHPGQFVRQAANLFLRRFQTRGEQVCYQRGMLCWHGLRARPAEPLTPDPVSAEAANEARPDVRGGNRSMAG
jgi:hypothetical protein